MPNIAVGFGNLASFEFTQRVARALAASTLVPEPYRFSIPNKRREGEWIDNPNAIPNCIIALNMASRLNADPLMVMQNLYIVEGRPSWSSQFVISAINSCGRFTALKFKLVRGEQMEVEYTISKWTGQYPNRSKVEETKKTKVRQLSCIAIATEKATGEVLESPEITMEMAVKEGWYGKAGSKWQTMPELMIRYRAASFFGRLYAPEILMGLRTQEEVVETLEAERDAAGVWGVPDGGVIEPDIEDVAGQAEEVQQGPAQHDPETGEVQDQAGPQQAETGQAPADQAAPAEAKPAERQPEFSRGRHRRQQDGGDLLGDTLTGAK